MQRARTVTPPPLQRRPVPLHRRVGVGTGPTRADDCARWRRERAEGRARCERTARALATAIDDGDARYRGLRRRLDDFGLRVEAVHARQLEREATHTSW
jgi:hypothetical protein